MQFTKMHGAGNDYVFVDCFSQPAPAEPAGLARAISDRHRGVGSDGLILIEPSETADARMRMWNADGSAGEMCGNGLRCVGKYLFDRTMVAGPEFHVETGAGVLTVRIEETNEQASRVRIEMGQPILEAERIPTTLPGNPPLDAKLTVDGGDLSVTCISMGNPHCVVFADVLSDDLVLKTGPAIERHPAFPARTNVEFVRVLSKTEIEVRVWERGSGETRACGTGACAAVVAGHLTGRLYRHVACRLPGGVLNVAVAETGIVYLTGPAVEVFHGTWSPPTA